MEISKIDKSKAGGKTRRGDVANINQKAAVFGDKRTKRNRTRQAQKDQALKDQG